MPSRPYIRRRARIIHLRLGELDEAHEDYCRVLESAPACTTTCRDLARVACQACRGEFLLAFSRETRGLCPSCQKRRQAAFVEFVSKEVLEAVGHRQVVLTIPKRPRPLFVSDRRRLARLARAASLTVGPNGRTGPSGCPPAGVRGQPEGPIPGRFPMDGVSGGLLRAHHRHWSIGPTVNEGAGYLAIRDALRGASNQPAGAPGAITSIQTFGSLFDLHRASYYPSLQTPDGSWNRRASCSWSSARGRLSVEALLFDRSPESETPWEPVGVLLRQAPP